ncbi:NAD(P)-binding protein [Coprinellus micaceus]|uniref:NAD(P)-binding protein n=1 Tax=Coprinellus micaceus TaxID=71717 RepID=A0A4Y7T4R9_COPMI|nr:NAD(P)-binding protein [Coprinellus micaceus]
MPAVPQPSVSQPILVTGASSYLGAHIVKVLLSRGYTVRAAVRSQAKIEELKNIFPCTQDTLHFVVVEDMQEEGSFDDAVKRVSAIIHTASPSILRNPNAPADEIVKPAVEGVLNLFWSALTHAGAALKRIVITSSAAAFPSSAKAHVNEDDWDDVDTGKADAGVDLYRVSKVLAERAAWDWYEAHKASISWDLTILLPTFMFGPPLYPSSGLGGTHKMFLDTVLPAHGAGVKREVMQSGDAWLDIRDAAEAHVRSLEREDVGAERVILSSESFIWQEWLDIANTVWAYIPWSPSGPPFTPAKGFQELTESKVSRYAVEFDTSKEKRLLGMEWRSKEEMMRDLIVDAVAKGWV